MTRMLWAVLAISLLTGCRKPFEPVKLEVVQPNEEAFLLPFTGDVAEQTSTNSEEYLKQNLVYTRQVQIPQQWVQKGYETFGYNGEWKDKAILLRVDKSPVTREWTAEDKTGTSEKDEAIWVMTSDQVQFSTGWVCTARIESRDDAVKFLHNYPNGSLAVVLDTEVRSKLQAEFGLATTDLPMEELRTKATPHIQAVVDKVVSFFKARGISITNLGISGGFIYKDPKIMQVMVQVFNAEQDKVIARSRTQTQTEENKTLALAAEAKSQAILQEKTAESEGIRLVADAKSYEIEKAKLDGEMYILLKQLEIQKAKLEKWDGKFPTYFMGGNSPEMLLQVPVPERIPTPMPSEPVVAPAQ